MKNFLRIPKVQLTICLLAIYIASLFISFSMHLIFLLILVVLTTVVSDFLFLKIRKKNLFFPSAAIVTSLIIVLLSDPNLPLYISALTGVVAMFSKNFIRFGRHIFNPASFGLAIVSVIFGVTSSWWGPSSLYPTTPQALPLFLILFLPFLVSGIRMKRYFTIFSFFTSYILAALISFQLINSEITIDAILRLVLDPSVIFFAFVMAPEPMTTPSSRKNQLLFGFTLGIFTILSSRILYQIPILQTLDPLIFSLLLANLIFFKYR